MNGAKYLGRDKTVGSIAVGKQADLVVINGNPAATIGDIRKVEPNIHAGVKYMRFMIDTYFKDEPMTRLNKGLMAFAAYNAGPALLRQLRRETAERGLDPNVWFGHVEVATGRTISREPVVYVRNILKYYTSYQIFQARTAAADTTDPGRGGGSSSIGVAE